MRKVFMTAIALALTAGCGRAPGPASVQLDAEPAPPWAEFRDDFIDRYFEFNPTTGVWAGRHEYDGSMEDYSPSAVAVEIEWLESQRSLAESFAADVLTAQESFERDHLVASIDDDLFLLRESGFLSENPVTYAFGLNPSIYLTREYAPLEDRFAAFTKHLNGIPGYLARMIENLETPLARPHIEVVQGILGGYASFFDTEVSSIFEAVDDPELWEAFERAREAAVASIEQTLEWIAAQLDSADDSFALGEDRFLTMLRMSEGVEISLQELIAAGETDLERNLAALQAACANYAPGASVADCVSMAESVKLDGGPVEGARQQLVSLKEFLAQADLVSIPGEEEALVAEAPPYARWNFAYINIPGPYEPSSLPSTYYIAPPDPSWTEEQQRDYLPGRKDLLYVSVHEVWPGHFLHFQHAKRSESPLARLFRAYSFSEGWAHYAEELMFEAGLDEQSAETQIGQLSNALLRNVRYLSAIGLHTGSMTVEESNAMFIEKAFQDFGNASQQANRGTFDPGYLNYTLGKLMIRKLRDDWTSMRGGRDAWKAFHDEFLSYGSPPIPLVREAMLGEGFSGNDSLLP